MDSKSIDQLKKTISESIKKITKEYINKPVTTDLLYQMESKIKDMLDMYNKSIIITDDHIYISDIDNLKFIPFYGAIQNKTYQVYIQNRYAGEITYKGTSMENNCIVWNNDFKFVPEIPLDYVTVDISIDKEVSEVEKYGTDMSNLPVTDDQLRQIKALGADKIAMPKNRQEADELIEKLASKNEEA